MLEDDVLDAEDLDDTEPAEELDDELLEQVRAPGTRKRRHGPDIVIRKQRKPWNRSYEAPRAASGGSWWTSAPREGMTATAKQHVDRMQASREAKRVGLKLNG